MYPRRKDAEGHGRNSRLSSKYVSKGFILFFFVLVFSFFFYLFYQSSVHQACTSMIFQIARQGEEGVEYEFGEERRDTCTNKGIFPGFSCFLSKTSNNTFSLGMCRREALRFTYQQQ